MNKNKIKNNVNLQHQLLFLPPLVEEPEKRLFVPVCIIDVDMFVIVVISDEIEDC